MHGLQVAWPPGNAGSSWAGPEGRSAAGSLPRWVRRPGIARHPRKVTDPGWRQDTEHGGGGDEGGQPPLQLPGPGLTVLPHPGGSKVSPEDLLDVSRLTGKRHDTIPRQKWEEPTVQGLGPRELSAQVTRGWEMPPAGLTGPARGRFRAARPLSAGAETASARARSQPQNRTGRSSVCPGPLGQKRPDRRRRARGCRPGARAAGVHDCLSRRRATPPASVRGEGRPCGVRGGLPDHSVPGHVSEPGGERQSLKENRAWGSGDPASGRGLHTTTEHAA